MLGIQAKLTPSAFLIKGRDQRFQSCRNLHNGLDTGIGHFPGKTSFPDRINFYLQETEILRSSPDEVEIGPMGRMKCVPAERL